MKKDYYEIALILDRSGSMQSLQQQSIKGYNDFISQQQQLLKDKEVKYSLILFDDQYDMILDQVNLQNATPLDASTYIPRGMTALLDAIGRTVNYIGDRLSNQDESSRPEKVIIAIMTDGQQNFSKEFTKQKIKSMIEHQENVYNWSFLFLSSDLNATYDATLSYGLKQNCTLLYSANSDGYDINVSGSSYKMLSDSIASILKVDNTNG